MMLKLDGKLWKEKIQPRFTIPDYVYSKRRRLFYENLPDITCHYPILNPRRDRTLLRIVLSLPRDDLTRWSQDRCPQCHSINSMIIHPREGVQICHSCGISMQDLSTLESGSYTQSFGLPQATPAEKPDLPRPHSNNIYKRCNHFKNWLQRLQGREKNNVTKNDILKITEYIRVYRIQEIDYHTVQEILRVLKLQRLYLHIFYIINIITGVNKFNLEQVHEERLLARFLRIQEAYAIHTPRANMLSYIYLITKFLELEGWDDMADELPRYKSEAKLQQADSIWKIVCREIGWTFIVSKR